MSTHNDKPDNDDHVEAWLGLYVLGGLTEEENTAVEALLATRPDLQEQVEELSTAVAYLPYMAEPVQPSPQMEADLMARVEANAQARFGVGEATSFAPRASTAPASAPPPPSREAETPSLWSRFWALWQQPALAGLAVGTAVVLLLWVGLLTQQVNGTTQELARLQTEVTAVRDANNELATSNAALATSNQELVNQNSDMLAELATLTSENSTAQATIARLRDELSDTQQIRQQAETELVNLQTAYEQLQETTAVQQQVADLLFAPQTYNVSLPGTEAQPEATGQLIVNPNQAEALLLVSGLPPLPAGQVYQVLLIYDTGHDTADTFQVDTQGESVLLVRSERPLSDFTAVGVSIEPEGGSPQRTGEIMILGELSQS